MDVDDVIEVNERYLSRLFREVLGIEVQLPVRRMTWQEAMDRFGSDKTGTFALAWSLPMCPTW